MRADRLVWVILLLQARGRMAAREFAAELGVSVRTIYRDMQVLSTAGVPVLTEPGPGGGYRLVDGYRFPLRALDPAGAEALLALGVPAVLQELGLDRAVATAHRQIRVTAGLDDSAGAAPALVHLDMPRWFGSYEPVPHLRCLAEALLGQRCLEFSYHRGDGGHSGDGGHRAVPRRVVPLGLVNKAGIWYLVATTRSGQVTVFHAGRITCARVLTEPASRPPDFDLAEFWERWSAEFVASRPQVRVRLRASPHALAVFPEVFGAGARKALGDAAPPDEHGWRELTLSFEHKRAAAHRLAGFGADVQVLSPPAVRDLLVATAHEILDRYGASPG